MRTQTKSYFGIDVSKQWFDLSVILLHKQVKSPMLTQRFDNTAQGIRQLCQWLKTQSIPLDENSMVVMENTGIYHRLLWQFFSTKHISLYIGNATHIRQSLGMIRGKSDLKDSQRLCDYAFKQAEELKTTPCFNPDFHKLKDMYTARTLLLKQIHSIRVFLTELKGANDKQTQKLMEQSHKAALTGLKKSLADVERHIKHIIQQNQAMYDNYRLLLTVPGIGPMTAIYLICCTHNFSIQASGKQLACYAGVVPFEYSSGKSVRGKSRVHPMANKELKRLLHLSALSAMQHYPEFKDYFDRCKAEGKHAMSILNAMRNKIVLRAAAVISKQQPYVDNYKKVA